MSPAHVQRCASGQVAAGTHTLCNEAHEWQYAGGFEGGDKFFANSSLRSPTIVILGLVPRIHSAANSGALGTIDPRHEAEDDNWGDDQSPLSSSGLSRGSIHPHNSPGDLGHTMRRYWVYILASQPRGTLYIGVTNDILDRVDAHKSGKGSIFTGRYRVTMLVYFEEFADVRLAIQSEKTLKRYVRNWKINLIERDNPHWQDLYPDLKARFG